MPRYLISFNYGTMDIPDGDDLSEIARVARAVVQEARDAGVLVFDGGVGDPQATSVVGRDGRVTQGPGTARREFIGGMTVVNVATREAAYLWAARIAAACRCPQEVREFLPDPSH